MMLGVFLACASAWSVPVVQAQYHRALHNANQPAGLVLPDGNSVSALRVSALRVSESVSEASIDGMTASATAVTEFPEDIYFRSGVQQVYIDGDMVFEETLGSSSVFHGLPMTPDTTFKVGSNTKLFTAFCIYKLHEMGLLNVSHDVALYLDADDFTAFGYSGQTNWCPTIHGGDGSCEKITFVHLMSMR